MQRVDAAPAAAAAVAGAGVGALLVGRRVSLPDADAPELDGIDRVVGNMQWWLAPAAIERAGCRIENNPE